LCFVAVRVSSETSYVCSTAGSQAARWIEVGGFWEAGTYGYTNANEYWAVGVTTWFDTVAHPTSSDVLAPQFLSKDALLYALLAEWLPVVPVLHLQNKW
jgi:hypothetical protein